MLQKAPSNLHFLENCKFHIDFWTPTWTQNRRKNVQNAMLKNNISFNRSLLEFSSLFPLKIELTSHTFRIFIESDNFVKIVLPSRRELDFQGFGPAKIRKKRCKNKFKKIIEKKMLRNRIWSLILASKILENRSGKRRGTKPVARRYANHPELGAS